VKPVGARYEIAIDGTPRTFRDTEKIALEAARHEAASIQR
jgi:hypothetical protein